MLSALKNLDDVTWAELVEQGRALIVAPGPPAAPETGQALEWTDHNASDPGITLLDLLAWIAEQDVYRVNRVPERLRRLALALCGVRPRAAKPARVLLRFSTPAGVVDAPSWTECSTASANPVRFRTVRALRVVAGGIEEIKLESQGRWTNLAWALRRGETPAIFGIDPQPGDAVYFALSVAPPPGPVSLGFLWKGSRTGEEERSRIRDEFGDAALDAHHSVRLLWEVAAAGGGWRAVPAYDTTRRLTLNGAVTVDIPSDAVPRVVDGGPPRIWVRARIVAGAYDRPPRLESVLLNAVEAEQTVAPQSNATVPAADVASAETPGPDAYRLGVCTGDPHQRFRLPVPFCVTGRMRVFTLEREASYRRWVAWEHVDDLIASGPAENHVAFDDARVEVIFGDGARGRLAPAGSPCFVEYPVTRGAAGRVAAGVVTRVGDPALAVTNPGASESGDDPENVNQAAGRAIEALDAPTRAMTIADIGELCRTLPGTLVARAEVIPNHLPGLAGVRATGVTTVVIVPEGEARRPAPSTGLLAAVASYLDARRIVGTRLAAVGPQFVEVGVTARVKAARGADPAVVRESIREALASFFHPLRGGELGQGWPLGRDVYRAEVLQLLDGVPGVDHVLALELRSGGDPPSCGNLCVPATGLTLSGSHQVEVL